MLPCVVWRSWGCNQASFLFLNLCDVPQTAGCHRCSLSLCCPRPARARPAPAFSCRYLCSVLAKQVAELLTVGAGSWMLLLLLCTPVLVSLPPAAGGRNSGVRGAILLLWGGALIVPSVVIREKVYSVRPVFCIGSLSVFRVLLLHSLSSHIPSFSCS